MHARALGVAIRLLSRFSWLTIVLVHRDTNPRAHPRPYPRTYSRTIMSSTYQASSTASLKRPCATDATVEAPPRKRACYDTPQLTLHIVDPKTGDTKMHEPVLNLDGPPVDDQVLEVDDKFYKLVVMDKHDDNGYEGYGHPFACCVKRCSTTIGDDGIWPALHFGDQPTEKLWKPFVCTQCVINHCENRYDLHVPDEYIMTWTKAVLAFRSFLRTELYDRFSGKPKDKKEIESIIESRLEYLEKKLHSKERNDILDKHGLPSSKELDRQIKETIKTIDGLLKEETAIKKKVRFHLDIVTFADDEERYETHSKLASEWSDKLLNTWTTIGENEKEQKRLLAIQDELLKLSLKFQ